ncbi:MAG: NTP transferase domain-containing protein [Bacillota bacterium]
MMVDAIVLAGSTNNGPLQACSNASNEALIEIGQRVMVDYVVAALHKSAGIGRIAVVGPVQELGELYGGDARIVLCPGGDTALDSVSNGINALQTRNKVLLATGDIPLISHEAIEDFLQLCSHHDADLYYPVVPKEINDQKFQGVLRTYIKLKEGTFTGGNLFLLCPQAFQRSAQKGEDLVRLRKRPLALCRLIGFGFVIKFLLHSLTLSEVVRKFSSLLDLKGVAVISSYPEVGIDVDKPSDLELVRRVLVP